MRIVLATDGSDHARFAEALLARLPLTRAASVLATSVTASASTTTALMQAWASFDFAQETVACVEAMRAHAVQVSHDAAARMRAMGLAAESRVLEGDPAHEITELAKAVGADLVACGSRSHRPLQAFLLGSVARKLVSHAPCSVLLAHPFTGTSPEASAERIGSRAKLHALVAVDGSPGSQTALEFLRRLDGGVFGRITTLCVQPIAVMPLLTDYPLAMPDFAGDDRARGFADAAASFIDGAADEVQALTVRERPATGILAQAIALDPDIVVIGAARLSGVERLLIGSVSYEVAVAASCPVLVVRG